jgi:hypothetical protein
MQERLHAHDAMLEPREIQQCNAKDVARRRERGRGHDIKRQGAGAGAMQLPPPPLLASRFFPAAVERESEGAA